MNSSPVFLIALAAILSLLFGMMLKETYLSRRAAGLRKGAAGEEMASTLMDESGCYDRLEGIVVGDGDMSNMAEIDTVIKGKACLVNVETKNWSGLITPHEDEDWEITYADGRKVRRRNPVSQARRQTEVLRRLYPDVAIHTLVLLVGSARFVGGQFPHGVCTPGGFRKAVRPLLSDAGSSELARKTCDYQWARLVDWAFDGDADKRNQSYRDMLETRYGENPWMGWYRVSLLSVALGMVLLLLLEQSLQNHVPVKSAVENLFRKS